MIKTYIDVRDPRWDAYKIDYAKIVRAAIGGAGLSPNPPESKATLGQGRPAGSGQKEISIILTNDLEIQALNKKYRGIDRPTNVLSFETGDPELLGDIYISFDCVKRDIKDEGRRTKAEGVAAPPSSFVLCPLSFINHTTHLTVHGVLHLLGYDHLNDSDADVMEALEIKILAKLGIDNPYVDNGQKDKRTKGQEPNKMSICPSVLLSFLFGLVASLGFAPFNLWPLTLLGIGGAYYLIAVQSKKGQRTKDKGQRWGRDSFVLRPLSLVLLPFAFGAGYAAASFWWVLNSIFVVPELAAQFAIWTVPGIIGIALAGGIIFGAPFIISSAMIKGQKDKRTDGQVQNKMSFCPSGLLSIKPVIFAASWTFVLWLREWLFTGFPWNPIANIAMPWPALANSMALWGALGLTFVIVGLAASVAEIIKGQMDKRTNGQTQNVHLSFCPFVLLLIIGCIYGAHNIRITERENTNSPVIRIVQPALSQSDKASHSREQALANAENNVARLVQLAKSKSEFARSANAPALAGVAACEASGGGLNKTAKEPTPGHSVSCPPRKGGGVPADAGIISPALIVFPETAYPYLSVSDELPMAREIGRPIIIGATSAEKIGGRINFYNSMLIADAGGKIEKIYSKSHLVPFGEYRPFGDLIPTPGQLTPGNGPEIVELSISNYQLAIVPAICYEIIFSDSLVPSSFVLGPSSFILNITNDTWFGKTPGTFQHLDMVRRYAIESGLPVVRANYSGISAFIGADGRVISSLAVGVSGVLDGTVSGAHITEYRRIGRNGTMLIILLFSAILAISISALRKKD
ncbi:MAG: apolipoprotein N-acyltransferase [Rickettsiales bacterium]|jgi:apolipoprotein N-acyltransferase|nr:apolipoprotein N-acyltransferase [Rickettsiales bacterium]